MASESRVLKFGSLKTLDIRKNSVFFYPKMRSHELMRFALSAVVMVRDILILIMCGLNKFITDRDRKTKVVIAQSRTFDCTR